jgi:protein-S-isoprenylcysteine O-methyltransferase Ste14
VVRQRSVSLASTSSSLGGVVAVILAFASFWIKLSGEEKLMLQQFPDQYRSCQQRVKRTIPFVL